MCYQVHETLKFNKTAHFLSSTDEEDKENMVEEKGIEDNVKADEMDSVLNFLRRFIEGGIVKNHSNKFIGTF